MSSKSLCVKGMLPRIVSLGGGGSSDRWRLVGDLQVIGGVSLKEMMRHFSLCLHSGLEASSFALLSVIDAWHPTKHLKAVSPHDHGLEPPKELAKINLFYI
jgi:hypothetical protein